VRFIALNLHLLKMHWAAAGDDDCDGAQNSVDETDVRGSAAPNAVPAIYAARAPFQVAHGSFWNKSIKGVKKHSKG
jgi:hypothetical protein